MGIKIYFAGNFKVYADMENVTVKTDQSVRAGGDETAPEPFQLFLASIGTCAGAYIAAFCKQRNIPYENITIEQNIEYDFKNRRIGKVKLEIKLPPEFPSKYKDAVVRAADQCAVKKYLVEPFEIETEATQN